MTTTKPSYKRVLLKLSGEALMGDMDFGIETSMMSRVAREIAEVSDMGIEVALVIGGGNIFRGQGLADRTGSGFEFQRLAQGGVLGNN